MAQYTSQTNLTKPIQRTEVFTIIDRKEFVRAKVASLAIGYETRS